MQGQALRARSGAPRAPRVAATGVFERYLALWAVPCIVADVALGQALPGVFYASSAATAAQVNLSVAGLI